VTRFRLDPALIDDAKLTPRQVDALERYDGRNYGYRHVGQELGISFETARGIVRAGLRKVELATRPEQTARPAKRRPETAPKTTRAAGKGKASPRQPSKRTRADVFDSSIFFDS
jgi:Sigma-70, region 4